MLKISSLYLQKQKSFVPEKICGMLVIETLESQIYDFLNSNTCFCSRLYGRFKFLHHGFTFISHSYLVFFYFSIKFYFLSKRNSHFLSNLQYLFTFEVIEKTCNQNRFFGENISFYVCIKSEINCDLKIFDPS